MWGTRTIVPSEQEQELRFFIIALLHPIFTFTRPFDFFLQDLHYFTKIFMLWTEKADSGTLCRMAWWWRTLIQDWLSWRPPIIMAASFFLILFLTRPTFRPNKFLNLNGKCWFKNVRLPCWRMKQQLYWRQLTKHFVLLQTPPQSMGNMNGKRKNKLSCYLHEESSNFQREK